jgi:osmoprotectant transport system permease protein
VTGTGQEQPFATTRNFGDGGFSWTAGGGIPFRTLQHLWVSLVATGLAIAIAVPPALYLSHHRRAEAAASAVVNIGRAIPSFGLIVLFWLLATRTGWVGTQFWPLVLALTALAMPPVFTNTYTAVRGVDAATVEAARGMGYTEGQVLRQIELPLASPVMLAGVRIAFLQVIATTAIGAIVTNGGGLGRFILSGAFADQAEPLTEHHSYEAMRLVIEGGDWTASSEYRSLIDDIDRGDFRYAKGCRRPEEVDAYFRALSRLARSIEAGGYRSQGALGGDPGDEIRVIIGQTGEPVAYAGGTHRLAAAHLLGVARVPVILKAVHGDWLQNCLAVYGGSPERSIVLAMVDEWGR